MVTLWSPGVGQHARSPPPRSCLLIGREQSCGQHNNSHTFYDAIKSIHGPQRRNLSPVRSADGSILYEDKPILDRWAENFHTLLNTSHPTQTHILDDPKSLPPLTGLDSPTLLC